MRGTHHVQELPEGDVVRRHHDSAATAWELVQLLSEQVADEGGDGAGDREDTIVDRSARKSEREEREGGGRQGSKGRNDARQGRRLRRGGLVIGSGQWSDERIR